VFLAFIIALIGYHPDTRISLYVGLAWIALLLLAGSLRPAASAAGAGSVIDAPVSIARPGRLASRVLPVILPKNSEMMSSAPGGYGKVCPFCTMRIHDVEGMAPSGCTLYQGATGPTVYYSVVKR
jgi:hypothetical protein